MLTEQIIDQQTYLANPTQYSDYFIISPNAYEEFETLKALEEADADIAAGRVYTHEEVFSMLDEKIARLEAQKNAKL